MLYRTIAGVGGLIWVGSDDRRLAMAREYEEVTLPVIIAEEELKASLVRRCLATTLSAALSEARHHCSIFFYELQEIEQRASRAAALEAKAVDVAKALRQDLYAS
ncbi:hypothetical protein ACLOJK_019297 [Asimina triloba]